MESENFIISSVKQDINEIFFFSASKRVTQSESIFDLTIVCEELLRL